MALPFSWACPVLNSIDTLDLQKGKQDEIKDQAHPAGLHAGF